MYLVGCIRKVTFYTTKWHRELPVPKRIFSAEELELNFQKIYREAKPVCKIGNLKT